MGHALFEYSILNAFLLLVKASTLVYVNVYWSRSMHVFKDSFEAVGCGHVFARMNSKLDLFPVIEVLTVTVAASLSLQSRTSVNYRRSSTLTSRSMLSAYKYIRLVDPNLQHSLGPILGSTW